MGQDLCVFLSLRAQKDDPFPSLPYMQAHFSHFSICCEMHHTAILLELQRPLFLKYCMSVRSCVCVVSVRQSDDDVSPCVGGCLLVDLSTARYLQYSTTDSNRRYKRALFVNFTGQPQHKWNTNIPYYFNFTGVQTGFVVVLFIFIIQSSSASSSSASSQYQ